MMLGELHNFRVIINEQDTCLLRHLSPRNSARLASLAVTLI